ncbi:ClpX C4-type zinc finger protein [Rhizobium skierniewicense]|uniref:ClpX C4-type zinc finger protein n=1 Tax=Rhizobium skierniewicense TaxID=984260 RepID=UPI00157301E0|nr:ClpX C4-type zinc finger protein [Rhizobium skierniewicense]NTF32335.1 hypothetical protein [Rhizobium skierniewicense]
MISPTDIEAEPSCTFCGKPRKDCAQLIAAPENKAFICEMCAVEAVDIAVRKMAGYPQKHGAPNHG